MVKFKHQTEESCILLDFMLPIEHPSVHIYVSFSITMVMEAASTSETSVSSTRLHDATSQQVITPKVVIEWLTLLRPTRGIPGSNLGPDTDDTD
jgi:hypothetical protein